MHDQRRGSESAGARRLHSRGCFPLSHRGAEMFRSPHFPPLGARQHCVFRCLCQLCRLDLSPQEEAEDCDSRRGAVQHQWVAGTEFWHNYSCFERSLVQYLVYIVMRTTGHIDSLGSIQNIIIQDQTDYHRRINFYLNQTYFLLSN